MTSFLKKKAIVAAVGVSSLCFVGAANAVVTSPAGGAFGSLTAPASVLFSGSQHGSSATLSDEVTFSVASTSTGDVGALSSKISGHNGWESFGTSLWNDETQLISGTSAQNSNGSWSSSFSYLLAAGPVYSIHIDGLTLADSSETKYSGSLTLLAVPEPETYAMMLAGLGLMGFVARRRRGASTAA